MDYTKLTERYWDKSAKEKWGFSQRCSSQDIEKAKNGHPELYILCDQAIPESWHPSSWKGVDVLAPGLAGGTHVPLMAAAGANVTSFDISKGQLSIDEEVCRETGLSIYTRHGDIQNLSSVFQERSFDIVITATASIYIKDIKKLWKDIYKVLRPGGIFISGAVNPVFYALDSDEYDEGRLILKNSIPYDGTQNMTQKSMLRKKKLLEPFQFGHSLEDIIGGQIEAGFYIKGFIEGNWGNTYLQGINSVMPTVMAMRAEKGLS